MKNLFKTLVLGIALFTANQMSAQDGYIGEIRLFAGNFAPSGWALCNGAELRVSGNEALFSILGTTYGGDGRTVFNLPDLKGRVPVGAGNVPENRANYTVGQKFGAYQINFPNPASVFTVTNAPLPAGTTIPVWTAPRNFYIATQPTFDNMQPSLVLNYIICVRGIYPTRD